MAQGRSGRGGGGPRRPGERHRSRPGDTSTGERPVTRGTATAPRPARRFRRPRLTSRAMVLLGVIALLLMSYASSLSAYWEQRQHLTSLKEQIARTETEIESLEREKRRWEDPAFTRQEARKRFGFLMPGEKSYVVLDEQGNPVDGGAELDDPGEVVRQVPTPWWDSAWSSVELAGNPPAQAPQQETVPADRLGSAR